MKSILLIALLIITVIFVFLWWRAEKRAQIGSSETSEKLTLFKVFIGFFTNFFDTLGIGSFATTSSIFKLKGVVPDELIPGTLNVGHCLPTVVEALIFISIIQVDSTTMVAMIVASILGAWLGAGFVAKFPRRTIQIGLSTALFFAAALMFASQMSYLPGGGNTLGLEGTRLILAIIGNFIFGALMTLGIGLFAPCMILVSLLGMNPRTAFPIMMGSCAFLMPVGSLRFVNTGRYSLKTALGLTLGGIPGVLLAAFVVKSLPLEVVRWLVICVVLYTAAMLMRSAINEAKSKS